MFEEKHINRFMDEIKELKDKMLEHTEKQEFVDMVSVFANRLEDENSIYVDELCKLYNVVSDVDIADTFVNYSMELVINQKVALEACKILCSLHGITHNLSTALFEILRFKQKRDNFDEEYLKEKLGVCWSNTSKMSKEMIKTELDEIGLSHIIEELEKPNKEFGEKILNDAKEFAKLDNLGDKDAVDKFLSEKVDEIMKYMVTT